MTEDDIEQYGEVALAMAQSVLNEALERRADPFVYRAYKHLLDGGHELTVRELGRVLAECGLEPRFTLVAIPADPPVDT